MSKELAIASALLTLLSGLCLSLGVLTPDVVKSIGSRFVIYMETRPRWALLRVAHRKALPPPELEPKEWFDQCLIELAVKILTLVIAAVLFVSGMLAVSIWALITLGAAHPVARWIPMFVSVWVCIAFVLDDRKIWIELGRSGNRIVRLFGKVTRTVLSTWRIARPLFWPTFKFVSLFTEVIPLVWYRTLKAIHRRGSNWLLTLTGTILLLGSFVLQLASVLKGP